MYMISMPVCLNMILKKFAVNPRDLEKIVNNITSRKGVPGLNRTFPRSQIYSCPCRELGTIIPSGLVHGVALSGSSASKSKLASPQGVPEMKRKIAFALKLKRNSFSAASHDTNQGD